MSSAAQAGLPRPRSFHRRRPMRLWWGAIVVALVANLGVVVALGQVSRPGHPAPTPPLALHRLRQIDPASRPPPRQQPRETTEPQADAAVPLALPSLELPTTSASALCLPAIGAPDATLELPIVIPPFTASGPAVDAPATPAAGLAIGPPVFDTAAQREGSFDLDRFYPRAARSRGITGTTRIRSHIDSAGRVIAVEVLESRPSGVFEQAAERLGKAQRYRPALKAGQRVPTIQDLTIAWTIR